MAKFELKLPKMGESVAEATITSWLKNVGDTIEADEAILEIATDKVDSEVPSEVDGTLVEVLFQVDDVVQVGQTIAIIETDGDNASVPAPAATETTAPAAITVETASAQVEKGMETAAPVDYTDSDSFYSPLVKNIAKEENISLQELESIKGTGSNGRVTKNDILSYVADKKAGKTTTAAAPQAKTTAPASAPVQKPAAPVSVNGGDEIIEMTRMGGKLISHHMIASVKLVLMFKVLLNVMLLISGTGERNIKTPLQKEKEKT
ncbi:dihydrolipoamide acyltransferase component ofbranched-chain alpha-keto acid dehydrogenase complex [Nonlabens ulvanivorans]|uniref:Dihydrolipoamide acyltransferase component ofbranched-chain alpha-keto acid dehydrogenase complex n=1 Tax=Nonlabens ulvanivorans TaxID=906888 RepID=A0A081DDE5_NONUL|nr:dihydrolipoamide acyltransferase component ofbranched-chain alpha-keto acid dehydrogenase complex [Nonlabens ulvanivorans]